MAGRVVVFDTSLMCCLLGVPGKDCAGPAEDRWDKERVKALIQAEQGSTFILPLATIIETGDHIAQAPSRRFEIATEFSSYIALSAEGISPWATFTEQGDLWSSDKLLEIRETWPALAAAGTSMGDATIRNVAEYYARSGFDVEIATADAGLKAYEPRQRPRIPRRRT